jgi:serine/threonine protein kinase
MQSDPDPGPSGPPEDRGAPGTRPGAASPMLPTEAGRTRAETAPGTVPGRPLPKTIGPYEILSEIGRGGMGVVYKALHPGLKRVVALKVLIAGEDASEEAVQRLHREAESVAKLGHHPNIVPVYDVGHTTGHGAGGGGHIHYFAMHFVDGKSLDQVIDEGALSPRPAAGIARKVAEALAHAHERGILHRDVKPANILMALPDRPDGASRHTDHPDRESGAGGTGHGAHAKESGLSALDTERGEGPSGSGKRHVPTRSAPSGSGRSDSREAGSGESWTAEPMLTDFGLAKDVGGDSRVTRSGVTLGTPNYMPPEQAEGLLRKIDARSDVYALGATLYEMLAGRPPFEGDTAVEVIRKVVLEDPVPPRRRNPRVDRDLETICLKCLEKAPARRYASARDLADDLGNWLDARPIRARPVSLGERLLRRAGRHPGMVATAASAAVLLAAGGVLSAHWILQERERARSQEVVAKSERERADRTAGEAERAARLGEKNRRVAEALLAAHAQLSRLHPKLKAACYDFADPGARGKILEENRETIEAFLASLGGDASARAAGLALMGWLRSLAGDADGAGALFDKARTADPDVGWGFLFEAMTALASHLMDRNVPPFSTGRGGFEFHGSAEESPRMKRARARFNELAGPMAEGKVWGSKTPEAFRAALEGLRNALEEDPAVAEKGLSSALRQAEFFWVEEELLLARAKCRWNLKDYDGGVKDARAFLDRCPGSARARSELAGLLLGKGLRESQAGGDPRPAVLESIEAFREAIRLCPGDPLLHNNLGIAHWTLAEDRASRGEDPAPAFRDAIASGGEALRLDPKLASALNNRGIARLGLGAAEAAAGGDPRPIWRLAMEDLDATIALDPSYANAFANRSFVGIRLGEEEGKRGGDAEALLRKAIEDAGEADRRDPASPRGLAHRGWARTELGEHQAARGMDPLPEWSLALADLDAAVAKAPGDPMALLNRGNVRLHLAGLQEGRGADPREPLRQAILDYEESLKADPRSALALANRGQAWRRLGRAGAVRGTDPREAYAKAIESCKAALGIDPRHASARTTLGQTLADLGNAEAEAGGDPRPAFREAVAAFDAVLAGEPGNTDALTDRASAAMDLGFAEERRWGDSREAYRKAAGDLQGVLEKRPGFLPALVNHALACLSLGQAENGLGGDPSAAFATALARLDEALRISPRLWQAHLNRGIALEELGRFEEAAKAFETTWGIVGQGHPPLRGMISRAQALGAQAPWARAITQGDLRLREGFLAQALAFYERGLQTAGEAGAAADPAQTETLRRAHYNAACLCSLGYGAAWKPPLAAGREPAGADARAIEHLRKAFELGWSDLDHIRKDTDLDPIRRLPAFEALLKEWESKTG